MKHSWTFEQQSRQRPSGENMAEPNFSRESKNIVRLFVREFFQNVIDARSDDPSQPGEKLPAYVRIRFMTKESGLDTDFIKEVSEGLEPHLIASGHISGKPDWSKCSALVLEEFHTRGLTGATNDTYAKGEDERWTNFWFGESRRSKTGTSLGRAGQGKITYHISSGTRSVFALSRRASDPTDYVFGKCIVRETHSVDGRHYTHHGYWPMVDSSHDDQPMPEADPSFVERFKQAFMLERSKESGTSWVIPFVEGQFSEHALAREFLRDFFFSVLTGGITVNADSKTIDASNLQAIFNSENFDEPSKEFFEFLVDCVTAPVTVTAKPKWDQGDVIAETSFDAQELEQLREDLKIGKTVGVKMPLTITAKDGTKRDSFITVFLQTGENLRRVEELYIRSGLVIAEEVYLQSVAGSGFGLVMANDPAISEFLGYCEVASHLKWNAKEQPAQEKYSNVAGTLSSVRRSLPKLYRLLAGDTEAFVEDALDDILSIAVSADAENKKAVRKKIRKTKKKTVVKKVPLVVFHQDSPTLGEWRLSPGSDAPKASYPLTLSFTFAYDRVRGTGNPWNKWHPYDFDLADTKFAPTCCKAAVVLRQDGQKLSIKLTGPKFDVRIRSFSKQQRLLVKSS
jgi:hypothetical protein